MAEPIGSLGTFRWIKHVIHVITNRGKLFECSFHIFCSNVFIILLLFLVLIRSLWLEKVAKYVIDAKDFRACRGSHLLIILSWLRRFLLWIHVLLLFSHFHHCLLLFHLFRRGYALHLTRTPSRRFGCLRHCLLQWDRFSNFLAWFRLHLCGLNILWLFLYQWSQLSFTDHGLLSLAIRILYVNGQLRFGLLLNWWFVSGSTLLLAFRRWAPSSTRGVGSCLQGPRCLLMILT